MIIKPAWPLPADFRIENSWFDHPSKLHGRGHTMRVMLLAHTLFSMACEQYGPLGDSLYRNLMTAALIHDLARKHDGFCMEHGLWARQSKRPIAEKYFLGYRLDEGDWEAIGSAVEAHARPDPLKKFPEGTLIPLLKDADGLDRIRLGYPPDVSYFRHPFTESLLEYARQLLAKDEIDLERELFVSWAGDQKAF